MSIEMACIVTATAFELLFWDVRWIIDLGSANTADRVPLLKTLLLCGIQLLFGAFVDVVSQHQQLKQNIPILSAVTGRNKIYVAREMFQFLLASSVLLLAMHVVPNVFFCPKMDVCECSFTMSLPAVAEHCGLGAIAKVSGEDDLEAARAWCAATNTTAL